MSAYTVSAGKYDRLRNEHDALRTKADELQDALDKRGREANELEARLLRMAAEVRAEAEREERTYGFSTEQANRLRAIIDRWGRL